MLRGLSILRSHHPREDKLDNYYIRVISAQTSRENSPGVSSYFVFLRHFQSFTESLLKSKKKFLFPFSQQSLRSARFFRRVDARRCEKMLKLLSIFLFLNDAKIMKISRKMSMFCENFYPDQ